MFLRYKTAIPDKEKPISKSVQRTKKGNTIRAGGVSFTHRTFCGQMAQIQFHSVLRQVRISTLK